MIRKSRAFDLEALRAILGNNKLVLAEALVKQVEVSPDFSSCQCLCVVLPDEFHVVAKLTFDVAGPEAGIHSMPVPNDLVLVGFADEDNAYILRRLSSKEDKIPASAASLGVFVMQALAGKKLHLGSDTKILVGKNPNIEPSEPLVLGNVLASALGDIIDKFNAVLDKLIAGPVGMGAAPGSPVPTYPQLITDLTALKTEAEALKTQYLDTSATNILSQIAFTER